MHVVFLINKDARRLLCSAQPIALMQSPVPAPPAPTALPAQVMSCFSAGLLSVPLTLRLSVFSGRASDRWTPLEGELPKSPAGDVHLETGDVPQRRTAAQFCSFSAKKRLRWVWSEIQHKSTGSEECKHCQSPFTELSTSGL